MHEWTILIQVPCDSVFVVIFQGSHSLEKSLNFRGSP